MIAISSPRPIRRIVGQNRCAMTSTTGSAAELERVAEVALAVD